MIAVCLGVPGKIIEVKELAGFRSAIVDVAGTRREASLMMLPEAKEGDYVLIHAGYAMQIIDEAEAAQTLQLLEQVEWSD